MIGQNIKDNLAKSLIAEETTRIIDFKSVY